jgi:thioredoxin 1
MAVRLILGILIGAGIGGLMGYFGKCASGACPLTANPLRGAFFGALIGILLACSITGCSLGPYGKVKNSMVINVGSIEAFEKAKDSNSILLADFYAEWCYPCKLLAPVLEKVAQKYQGKAAFYKVDVEQFQDLAIRNGVKATPTVIVFKDGKVVEHIVGLRHEADYSNAINKLLQTNTGAK